MSEPEPGSAFRPMCSWSMGMDDIRSIVPIEMWSEVAKCALRSRVTTTEVLMAALAEYLRAMRQAA